MIKIGPLWINSVKKVIQIFILAFFWTFFVVFLAFPDSCSNILQDPACIKAILIKIKNQELASSILEKKTYILVFVALVDFIIEAILIYQRHKRSKRTSPKLISDSGRLILVLVLVVIALFTQIANEEFKDWLWSYLILFILIIIIKYQSLEGHLILSKVKPRQINSRDLVKNNT